MDFITQGDRVTAETRAFFNKEHRMLINGKWVDAVAGARLEVHDPADEKRIASVPAGDQQDIDLAVAAARAAFETGDWHNMRPAQRERLLLKLADLIEADAQNIAEIESIDNGKPVMVARYVDVALTIDFFRYMAGWATKLEGTTADLSVPFVPDGKFMAFTRKEPVGVVGAIVAWNFPLLLAAWKLGPALATGCTVVLKPAEQTPMSALRLGELIVQAGYPAGVVNIVTGYGQSAGAALAAHTGINKVTFTGSTAVGKMVGKMALDNMTRISLELGGKSPMIVLDDYDPAAAAAGAAQGIFFNAGQVCCAGSRLYVHKKIFDRVVSDLSDIASKMKIGHGLDTTNELGPLVSRLQMDRVRSYIDSGIAQGAKVAAGGDRSGTSGYFVQPTVLVDVNPTMRVVEEEIFGPVLVAMPYDDLDEVAAWANDTVYGLSASIWSNNLSQVHRLIPKIKAGTVWVNCHSILDSAMPFGGYKQSGFGREMGKASLDLYTESKSVIMSI
ncbi:phenylacetaldehyde dehydrogenase [Oxalobacteraceae bacterium GrIS 2.11]